MAAHTPEQRIIAAEGRTADPDRGIFPSATLVDPYALRRLADVIEEVLPGSVDEIRG